MIHIDGKEAGGQILRSALSLSAITKEPFEIVNIRASRNEGGLKQQHLEGVKAMASICNADVKDAFIGSKELSFYPRDILGGNYKIDIGTAGSITLVLQTLIPALLFADKKTYLEIKGGTDVKWSPSFDYYYNVPMRYLEMFNVDLNLELIKRGFYPKGNGIVKLEINPCRKLRVLNLVERGDFERIDLFNYATSDLKKADVIERQRKGFEDEMKMKETYHMNGYVDALSTGTVMHAHAHYEKCILGVDILGDKGKKAEDVGEELAKKLKFEINSKATVDQYMADQILIFMALAKEGSFITSKITDHVLNNIKVIEKFLDVKFKISDCSVSCYGKN
nr:RNA 3'-phosphate cyclase [Candidatus Woesearchaeota archaeon]